MLIIPLEVDKRKKKHGPKRYFCPNGCGKKIIFIKRKDYWSNGIYQCQYCATFFIKKGGPLNNPNLIHLKKQKNILPRDQCRLCDKDIDNNMRSAKRPDMCRLCMSGE